MEILKNATFRKNLIISAILILSASGSFGLGRLSVLIGKKEPIAIEGYLPVAATTSVAIEAPPHPVIPAAPIKPASTKTEPATYVASKTGKKYYFPWCGIVKRIKPENLISFNSKIESEKAGYTPGSCAGLK